MSLFHRHRWATMAADVYERNFLFTRGPLTGQSKMTGEVTVALQQCECGAVRTRELQGAWTLDQLREMR